MAHTDACPESETCYLLVNFHTFKSRVSIVPVQRDGEVCLRRLCPGMVSTPSPHQPPSSLQHFDGGDHFDFRQPCLLKIEVGRRVVTSPTTHTGEQPSLSSGWSYRLHKTGFRSMFNISPGRRNTVNLGAFGHICQCTLTLQWYKIRFYGPYQTN